jgi:fumarylacetoacetase
MKSWISYPSDCDFSIYNIPFGVIAFNNQIVLASAIGTYAVNLHELCISGFIEGTPELFQAHTLNRFIAKGKPFTTRVRLQIQQLLSDNQSPLALSESLQKRVLIPLDEVKMQLPIDIGDYTDFYSSIDHATNIGKMIRDPENALLPNWKHLPVAYHGRASSIGISGQEFHRPKGQRKLADQDQPVFGPTKALDIELEMAFVIGKSTTMGQSVSTAEANTYIFGMTLFNDWSARDIQTWEYIPLGPFLAKNFASTMSPWIVTLEALEPFRVEGYVQNPPVLPYLQYTGNQNLDIELQVYITPQNNTSTLICHSNYKFMYWTMAQQLAHHTVNGCPVRVGDLMASGTISGPEPSAYGSLMELSWKGTKPLTLHDGSQRTYIEDFDTVTITGFCTSGDVRVGFGSCQAKVLPAL